MIRQRRKETARARAEKKWTRDSLDPAGVAECRVHKRAIMCFRNASPRQRAAWDTFFVEHMTCGIDVKPIRRA